MNTPIVSPLKTCTTCNRSFPQSLEYFYSNKRMIDGFNRQCKECVKAREKKRRDADPEFFKEYSRLSSKRHRSSPQGRQIEKEWLARNKDKTDAYRKKWRKNNPEMDRAIGLRAVAKRAGAEGRHDGKDVIALYEMQDGRCGYCGIPCFNRDYQVDHIVPLSRGGSDWPDNLIIACQTCNKSKADKLLEEWEKTRGW